MNTYNVYKDKKCIGKNISRDKLKEITGINIQNISRILGQKYKGFLIEYAPIEDKIFQIPAELEREWEDTRSAAQMIKSGRGHIVTKKIKGKIVKYVEGGR